MIQISILLKSFLIWSSIIPIAFINGGLREVILIPRLGKMAFPISGALLIMSIFFVSVVFIPKLDSATPETYIVMGILWMCMTVAFEFSLGFIRKIPFSKMLEAYNITSGNLWLLVVIFIGLVPFLVAHIKEII